jgi:hypothetical protein
MGMSGPDYNDTVEIENTTNEMISVWWGTDIYNIPPGRGGRIPRIVAKGCVTHESYKGLRIVDEQANAKPAEGAKVPTSEDKGTEAPKEVLAAPWSNSEWDAITCPMDEVTTYVNTFNLKIPENTPGETIRTIVDEHFMGSLG